MPAGAKKIATLGDGTTLHVDVVLKPSNPTALANYAEAVSDPSSPSYRHYLDTAGFASLFGPSPGTIATVKASLRAAGLRPGRVSANHLSIPLHATAGQLERGFSTRISRYRLKGGRIAFANSKAPELPASAAADVQLVAGLDDLVDAQPGAVRVKAPRSARGGAPAPVAPQVVTGGPQPCTQAGTESPNAYTADQVASAYGFSDLYGQGDEGQGQTVALIEGEPDLASDIAAYQSCYHTSAAVSYVSVDGGPGIPGAGSGEAALDIEQIIGLAPRAHIVAYQSTATFDSIYDDYLTAISADSARVISTSWGTCEAFATALPDPTQGAQFEFQALFQAENTLFEEAAAQGQSVVAASGDSGSEGCNPYAGQDPTLSSLLSAGDPAAQPFVIGAGGTTLPEPDAPATESVWNSYGASGGGISSEWPMPSYQSDAPSGLGVSNAYSSGQPCAAPTGDCREVPDVSADADPYTGYAVYWKGAWTSIGGTSAAAPLWASLLALTDASSGCAGTAVGFADPVLYAVAAGDPGAFNDVTSGNNDYTRLDGGTYPALRGYDMATGLGTPTANLPGALCSAGSPSAVQITSASSTLFSLGDPASFTVTTSGPAAPAITATGPLPAGMALTDNDDGTATLAGTPQQTGSFPVTLDATGTAGSARQSFTVTVGSPPAITSAATATFVANTSGSFSMHASGSPTPSVTLTSGTMPSGLALTSTGEIVGTPLYSSSGAYPITVQAANGVSPAASQSVVIDVDGPPRFTSAPEATFVLGTRGSFTITTSAEPAANITEVGAVPPGTAFTNNFNGTATVAGTPTKAGTFSLVLKASNTRGGATPEALTIKVLASVRAPAFTSPRTATFYAADPGTFRLTATGSPPPTFSIVSGGLPATSAPVTLSSAGVLSGHPGWNSGGVYPIVVEADNGVGAPAVETITLTVDQVPEIFPSIYLGSFENIGQANGGPQSTADVVLGQPGSLQFTQSGFPLPALSESGPLPPGLSFGEHAGGTFAISGTATVGGTYPIAVTARNSSGATTLTVRVVVAPTQAPFFVSPSQFTLATAKPCGNVDVYASGFPYPKVTETSAAPTPLGVDDSSASTNWDPGTAVVGACSKSGSSGTYHLTFAASNSAGSASQSVTVTLSPTAGKYPALFTSPTSTTFSAGVNNAFQFRLSNSSGECVTQATGIFPVWLALGDVGELWGVPPAGAAGTYPLTVSCGAWVPEGKDGKLTWVAAIQHFTLVVAGPPQIRSTAQTTFALGRASTFTVRTIGSPAPVLAEAGSLPPGTSFVDHGNGTATISGTPTEDGTFGVSVSATNNHGAASQDLTVSVTGTQPLAFTSRGSVTFDIYDQSSFRLETSGAPTPVFSVLSGRLPSGLTLSADGLVSGIPEVSGSYPLVVQASNGVVPNITQHLSVVVDEPPRPGGPTQPGWPSLVFTYVGGASISQLVYAQGYPLTFSATGLPSGLSLINNGPVAGFPDFSRATLMGTPRQIGTFSGTVYASNAMGTITAAQFTIISLVSGVQIVTSALPAGTAGAAYSAQLRATGGVAPYAWQMAPGSKLPPGLKLNRATGLISGRLAKADGGTYHFSAEVLGKKVNGHSGSAIRALAVTVARGTAAPKDSAAKPAARARRVSHASAPAQEPTRHRR